MGYFISFLLYILFDRAGKRRLADPCLLARNHGSGRGERSRGNSGRKQGLKERYREGSLGEDTHSLSLPRYPAARRARGVA